MHHWKITLDTTIHTGHFLISYDDSEKEDGEFGVMMTVTMMLEWVMDSWGWLLS